MAATWISPPEFDDDRLDYIGRIAHASLLSTAIVFLFMCLVFGPLITPDSLARNTVMSVITIMLAAVLMAVNRRNPVLACALFVPVLWVIFSVGALTAGGVQAPILIGYAVLVMIGRLAFGARVALAVLLATIAAVMLMAWMEIAGLLAKPWVAHNPLSRAVAFTLGVSLLFTIVSVASDAAWGYLETRRTAEAGLRKANASLDETVAKLNARAGQLRFIHLSTCLVSWVWDIANDEIEWLGDPAAMTGAPPASAVWTFNDYRARLHPDDLAPAIARLSDGLKGSRPYYRARERILLPDGGIRWLEAVGSFEYGPDGRAVRMSGTLQDVTEQQQAYEVVAENERRYRGLFDSALDGIVILSPDGVLVDVNPACRNLTGFTREELIGHSIAEFLPAEDVLKQPLPTNYHVAHGSVTAERRIKCKDGSLLPVEINRWSLPDGNAQAILRDLRERKRAEQRFSKIFRIGPAAMTISRVADGKYIDANDVWYRWSGYSREEAIGRTATDIGIWVDSAERKRLVAKLAESGSVQGFASRLRWKSGEVVDIVLAAEVLELEGESYMVVSIEDVTERKRAEAEVVRLNASLEERVRVRTAELQDANNDLESFSYSISHDLRAPLRRILSFTQLLERAHGAGLGEAGRHMLARVDHNARRMSELIEDLLSLSKIGKGQIENRRLVDMHAEVTGLLEELGLSGMVEVGELPSAEGDPSLLRQVWQNLILNAVKFSRNAGTPRIRVFGSQLPDGRAEFSVKDNGVGFDMAHVDKLFGVFQRLHPDGEFEGTGVGLALVQRIVGRHGGKVSAHSTPGDGALFKFTLAGHKLPA